MRDLRNQRDLDSIIFEPSSPELHIKAIQAVRSVLADAITSTPGMIRLSHLDTIEDSLK